MREKLVKSLVELWRTALQKGPQGYVAEKDQLNQRQIEYLESYDGYLDYRFSSPRYKSQRVHTGLLPVPYVGDLKKAKVFIFLLNPGLSAADYYAEKKCLEYQKVIKKNLLQEFSDKDQYPFFCLDPRFAWTPAFEYWYPRMRPLLEEVKKVEDCDEKKGLQIISQNIACLELCGYHSATSGFSDNALNGLTSVYEMTKFIKLLAEDKDILILVVRGQQYLKRHGIVFPKEQTLPPRNWTIKGHVRPIMKRIKDVRS